MDFSETINAWAKELNFDEVGIINPDEFLQYKIDTQSKGIDYGLYHNPKDIMGDAECIIVLLTKYSPYDTSYFQSDYMIIDSYYVASNAAYHNAGKLAEKICRLGYKSDYKARIPYRHCAFRANMGIRGVNGLLVHREYGSYINIQCILTNLPVDNKTNNTEVDFCNECDNCRLICKFDAINKDGIVSPDTCKRAYMPAKKYISVEIREKINRDIIGCDDCKAACPLNNKIDRIKPPEELLEACYLPRLMDFEHNKANIKVLVKYLGKNEVRTLRLAKSLIILSGNTRDEKYIPLIKNIQNKFKDDEIDEYSDWAINNIQKKCLSN